MTNWYAEAIEILAGVHEEESYQDAVKLATEIAKKNPKAVVDAWRRLHPPPDPPVDPLVNLREECRKILSRPVTPESTKQHHYIQAIKHYRSVTGTVLKEAKDEIDKLR